MTELETLGLLGWLLILPVVGVLSGALTRKGKRIAALEAEVERERALRQEAIRDNREKTNAIRELQAALAGVLQSYEAYELLCDPFQAPDEYAQIMRPAWEKAASLVPGFDPKALTPWVEATAP
jgi:hypothetical protein